MGGGGSQSINQNFNMSVVNDILYESVTKNESINENTMENIQGMELNVLRNVGCNISTEQSITSSFTSTTEQITDSFQNVENDIVSELQAQAAAALDQQSQMGNLQIGDRQNVTQNINSEIQNIVKTQLTTENLTKTVNKAVNIQEQTINIGETICLNGETLSFKQNISADLAAQAVAKNLLSAVTTNKLASEIAATSDATITKKAGGAAEVIDSVGNAFTGPIKYAIIACGVCCCLLIVFAIVMAVSQSGTSGQRPANGGANR